MSPHMMAPHSMHVARQVAQIGVFAITSNGRKWWALNGLGVVGSRDSMEEIEQMIRDIEEK